MTKRSFLTLIALIIIIIVGFFAYFLFFAARNGGEDDGKGIFATLTDLFPSAPGGRPIDTQQGSLSTNSTTTSDRQAAGTTEMPRLVQISTEPVAGMVVFAHSGKPVVRYAERGTGHIYEYELNSGQKTRISNTTVTQIQEAVFSAGGTRVIDRFLSGAYTLKSFSLPLTASSSTGTYLSNNIPFIAPSPDRKSILYLEETGVSVRGFTSDFAGGAKQQVFEHSAREWLPEWPSSGTVALTTKASGHAPGYLYLLTISSGALTRILGGIHGLVTTVSPDTNHVFYATGGMGYLSSSAYVISREAAITLPVATLPEKCAWSRSSNAIIYCGATTTAIPQVALPDAWYQGTVAFTDALWHINTDNGQATEIASPQTTLQGKSFDMISPQFSDYDQYFVFMDKGDGTLWSYRVYDQAQVDAMKAAQKPALVKKK